MKMLYHPDRKDIQLSSVLYALSDPVRLYVVSEIRDSGEQSCSSFNAGLAKSTMSHHLRTLRESGVVYTRAQGTQRLISLRTEDLEARFPGLLESVLQAYAASGPHTLPAGQPEQAE
ncbi:helix-turn-helix transcriptional regulator [Paenibacillus sp. NFR01]|uniref:ArsR/SmtB family transcription factor n=1 Tax=Paenibacillus sp. NFR01 TaxID=1566279 RepID=UPI0008D765B9|nr:helix-turn-helix transcriptional regulator [Paenibacillus sp. NFR01]SEU01885.1 DNA-binding transcriptional regulator, ArsR family [Paenibacillus sp. NFR01]